MTLTMATVETGVTGRTVTEGPGLPVIELVHPMPGFPDVHHVTLGPLDGAGLLSALRAVDRPGLKFLTVPSSVFRPDFTPVIDDEVAAALGIDDVDEVLVLLIVHAGPTLATTTVNLRAPVIVNTTAGLAAQVILDDQSLAVDAPLLP